MNSKKTVLITGASSGLGLEFAKLFAEDFYDLILVARNKEKLEQVVKELTSEKVKVTVLVKDLADPKSPQEIFTKLQQDKIEIDVLINNAGFASHGKFAELDEKNEMEEVQVNVVTLTHLTKLFLSKMVERGEGKILNIASTAAFVPGPLMAVYFATKAYVLSFSEALSEELVGTGVTLSVLCPGPTKTGFQKRGHMQNATLPNSHVMEAKEVVKIGYAGLMQGKTVIIPGLRNKLLTFGTRLAPRSIVRRQVMYANAEEIK